MMRLKVTGFFGAKNFRPTSELISHIKIHTDLEKHDLIPYAFPGSDELAELTVKSLRNSSVTVLNKHGALATGKDASEAFDFIDVANKGAKLYLKCLASGFEPAGLSKSEMKEIFDLTLLVVNTTTL